MKTFTIKTPKGRECTIGIRKEYEYDELFAKQLGGKHQVIDNDDNVLFDTMPNVSYKI